MTTEVEIRALRRDDDRSAFRCGQPDLDRFFRDFAGQNQFRLHVAVSYVAVTDGAIAGFATVAAGAIERRDVPSSRLRRRLPRYPLPVLRLARLGVHEATQGLGVGAALARHVLLLALTQRDRVGCVGVVADSKPAAVPFYERLGFIALEGVREGLVHGDPMPMFLPISTIGCADGAEPDPSQDR